MITRNLQPVLERVATQMPVVFITGPRQSGKTTLCRTTFPDWSYVSLEPLDTREFATSDPRGFLATYRNGVIFDEIHKAPDLLSYIQDEVDRSPEPGRFILTGSHHFAMTESISQSLAGRVGILTLLPPSFDELQRFPAPPRDLWMAIWKGAYPRIYDRKLEPNRWLADYVTTYLERDVREVLRVVDLEAFGRFLRLVAGSTAQELNRSRLGNDVGVSHNTIRAWLSVLEQSFITFHLPAWERNVRKREVKAPKMHLFDTGLACHLLGIREPDQLRFHPLRGALFETWVVAEVYKWRMHRGLTADLFHYRSDTAAEIDLILEEGNGLLITEIKSGATVAADWLNGLRRFSAEATERFRHLRIVRRLIYGGDASQRRSDVEVRPWKHVADAAWQVG